MRLKADFNSFVSFSHLGIGLCCPARSGSAGERLSFQRRALYTGGAGGLAVCRAQKPCVHAEASI